MAASISGVASASRPWKVTCASPTYGARLAPVASLTAATSSSSENAMASSPREQMHPRACRQCQGEHAQRTGITRELDEARRQHVPGSRRPTRMPRARAAERQPPTPVPSGHVLASEGVDRPSQRRRSCGVSLCDQQRQAIQQQIGRARRLRRWRRCPGGPRGLQHALVARQHAGEEHGGERVQIGFTREPLIEWFEALGGLEQQGWSVAAAAQRERDLTAEQVDLGVLELVQRSGLCDRNQS